MQIKTRKQAAEAGENKYYTGRPCAHGHESPRYTSTGICCKCNSVNVSAYNKRMRTTNNNKQAGVFVYPAHPDDHAALLAYAQALDLQRGRCPPSAAVPSSEENRLVLPADIARFREVAISKAAQIALPPLPANPTEDQLRLRAIEEHNARLGVVTT